MPRDSNGRYTLPPENPVVPDTIIETDWANPTLADISNELTNSLDRNGRGAMLGPLLIADGVGAAPGLAFAQDPTSGLYRAPVTGSMMFSYAGSDMMEMFLDITNPATPVPSINFIAAVSFGATTTTFDDGSRLQPGIRFTNEQQTGLYRAGTNDMRWDVAQVDMAIARSADGVRFPYDGEGSPISLQRTGQPIMREMGNASAEYLLVNGARSKAAGDGLLAEQSFVDVLRIAPTKLTVELASGQVIGNTVTPLLEVLKADATGVYAQGNKLATEGVAVLKAGDTMTGPLVLAADPVAAMQAVTKQYVDSQGNVWNGTGPPAPGLGGVSDFYIQTGMTTAAVLDTSTIGSMSWRHAESAEWKQLQGQTLSKTTFPQLWTYAQSYLTADQVANPGLYKDLGGDNFAVPIANGLFLRNIGGTAAALGVLQTEMIGPHTHIILPSGHSALVAGGSNGFSAGSGVPTGLTTASNTGTENRPKNIALILCVRAVPITLAAATTTGTAIWGPKTGAGWPASSVPLAQGPTGAQGIQGIQGIQGVTGATGVAGGEARNYLINGGFDVWQRNTGFSNMTTTNFYAADRWGFNRTGDVANALIGRQPSAVPGSRYYLLWQRGPGDTSTATMVCYYALETADSVALAGKTVTFSVWLQKGANYSSASNFLTLNLYYGTGTDQRLYAFTGATVVATATPSITGTWTRYSITGAIPSNATEVGVQLSWNPVGTAGANDYVGVAQAQLEVGASATAYAPRSFAQELLLCSRYYQKAFDYNIVPANGTNNFADASVAINHNAATATSGLGVRFVGEMRKSPTVLLYNPRAGGGVGRFSNGSTDDSAASQLFNIGTKGMTVVSSSIALGPSSWYINWSADAEL